MLNRVDCNPNDLEATLLECRSRHITNDCQHHSKDAGVRCQIDSRLKDINAMVTGADTANTVSIRWQLQNSMQPYLVEVECFNEQHKIVQSVSNTTFNMQIQGLLSSTSYTCCVLALYREDDGPKRICTAIKTPNLLASSIQPQNKFTSSSTSDETLAPECNLNSSASGSANNTVFGVLGLIIGVLLILLALCGVVLVYLLQRLSVTSKR